MKNKKISKTGKTARGFAKYYIVRGKSEDGAETEDNFFLRLGETVKGFVKYYIGEEKAEDVRQEVLEVLVEKGKHQELGREDLERYAHKTAENKLGNYFQAEKTEKGRFVAIEDIAEPASTAPSPYEHLVAQELEEALKRACARMSLEQRRIIEMLRLGASNEEIMLALGLRSLKDTKQRIWRARKQLRELLEEEGYTL